MRHLYLLHGPNERTRRAFAPANDITIHHSDIRDLYGSTTPVLNQDHDVQSLGRHVEAAVLNTIQSIVTERMHHGHTIILNTPDITHKSVTSWAEQAKPYGYQVTILDATPQGYTLDDAIADRDLVRESEHLLARRYAQYAGLPDAPDTGVPFVAVAGTTWEQWAPRTQVANLDHYKRVILIGDVQGCGHALNRMIDTLGGWNDPETHWVFLGDLFDRGPTPELVMERLADRTENTTFITGNHERAVRETLNGIKEYRASGATVRALRSAGWTDESINDLMNRGLSFFPFDYAGKHRWATHGGVAFDIPRDENGDYFAADLSDSLFMIGTGNEEQTRSGRGTYQDFAEALSYWTVMNPGVDVQYHGHRSEENTNRSPLAPANCLESGVEFGETLSAMVLTHDGDTRVEVQGERAS